MWSYCTFPHNFQYNLCFSLPNLPKKINIFDSLIVIAWSHSSVCRVGRDNKQNKVKIYYKGMYSPFSFDVALLSLEAGPIFLTPEVILNVIIKTQ